MMHGETNEMEEELKAWKLLMDPDPVERNFGWPAPGTPGKRIINPSDVAKRRAKNRMAAKARRKNRS